MNNNHKFNYKWKLSDSFPAPEINYHGSTVFSTFACGGGSSMGYKLAGYDVLGYNEIDPKMARDYDVNLNPKLRYVEDIRKFKLRNDFPDELYNLDILDGSPPCSSFSMAGNREKDWGKEKKFREGQAKQTLDDLFFDFINLAEKLQPKIVLAENVKGILFGKAIGYVKKIYQELDNAGYYVQHWLLNASTMGVPQRRERVFFIALRKDLAAQFMYQKDLFTIAPLLKLEFNEPEILYKEIENKTTNYIIGKCTENSIEWYNKANPGESFAKNHPTGNYFNLIKVHPDFVLNTITASSGSGWSGLYHYNEPRHIYVEDVISGGTFPIDYNYLNNKPNYIIGISVPPIMIAQIAHQIYEQWLKYIKK